MGRREPGTEPAGHDELGTGVGDEGTGNKAKCEVRQKGAESVIKAPMEPGFYNMDCMIGMAQFPDKWFELAIVDPPFGLGDKTLTSGGTWAAKYKIGDAAWDKAPTQAYFDELLRTSKNQIIWGGNYFELGSTRGYVIWDKVALMDTMSDSEFAWTSFDRNAKTFRHPRNTSETRIHICQKPIALYKWLLTNYAKPGDKILDTHVGSASSLIACHQMGFEYWGFELDADYFKAASERLERAKAQVSMFDTDAQGKEPEQIAIV